MAAPAPAAPEMRRVLQRKTRVFCARHRQMRRPPCQLKRHLLASAHGEIGAMGEALGHEIDGGAQHHAIRPGDGAQHAPFKPVDPGFAAPIIKPQQQLGAKINRAMHAAHDAHEIGIDPAQRHEINHLGLALGRGPARFKDQRSVAITPRHARRLVAGAQQETPVRGIAQKGGETGAAIKARPAEPVDRALARDKRRRFAISNERVIFYWSRQAWIHRHAFRLSLNQAIARRRENALHMMPEALTHGMKPPHKSSSAYCAASIVCFCATPRKCGATSLANSRKLFSVCHAGCVATCIIAMRLPKPMFFW